MTSLPLTRSGVQAQRSAGGRVPVRANPWPGRLSRVARLYGPLALYGLFTLIPFYWMLVFAFRPAGSDRPVPWPLSFANFDTVWNGVGFSTFFLNSVLVAVSVMIATTFVAVAAGYALARFRFRGKGVFVLVLLCTQFVPGAMLLIPLFVIFKQIALINNLGSLIVIDTVFQIPLAAMLMSTFIRGIPFELEEAAMLDGCSRLQAFRATILPLMQPALVAVGSFAFIGAWNNFLFALMFISRQDRFTIPVGLSYTLGQYNIDFGALAAGGVVAAVPVVAVFAVVQRYLVQGLSAGAVKG
ncbi:carbohydrate ABC transporter permease [Nakamurella endophytica]|uniref:Transporter n=1 Tax=Nakamurella endophytica TaxID=1748367 RepID=A0A917SVP7_9ACTN|nr:carbohydrate ABC transporter permease [Nakamurella endophytica]GGL98686.1 transporter [Nakamurella endophytica]